MRCVCAMLTSHAITHNNHDSLARSCPPHLLSTLHTTTAHPIPFPFHSIDLLRAPARALGLVRRNDPRAATTTAVTAVRAAAAAGGGGGGWRWWGGRARGGVDDAGRRHREEGALAPYDVGVGGRRGGQGVLVWACVWV